METTIICDVSEYRANIAAGMDGRQLVLSVLGVIVVVLSFTALKSALGLHLQAASYMAIFLGLPLFLFAFCKPRKMPFEKYLKLMIQSKYLSHRHRICEGENLLYDAIFTEEKKTGKKAAKGGKKHGTMDAERE